jgi:hypothetical protein
MLGIFAVGAPEVKSARVPQRVHAEVDLDLAAPDDRAHRAPVAWQLPPRLRFEPDSHPARPQHPLRPDLVAQNRELPRIPSSLELAEDHLCVPDALAQQLIEVRAIGVKQPLPRPPCRPRRAAARQSPADRLGVHHQLSRHIADVATALHQCLNHHEVLLPEHLSSSLIATVKRRFCFGV